MHLMAKKKPNINVSVQDDSLRAEWEVAVETYQPSGREKWAVTSAALRLFLSQPVPMRIKLVADEQKRVIDLDAEAKEKSLTQPALPTSKPGSKAPPGRATVTRKKKDDGAEEKAG